MIIGNERFDPSNRDEPIQRLITDQYYRYFTLNVINFYHMFIGKNTYEMEGGILNSDKTGKFYAVTRENTHTRKLSNTTNKVFFYFVARLEGQVKHYKSIAYGVIDVIGTLGGVFEILFWSLMLLYGSIQKNVYLFSVINSLIQIIQNPGVKSRGYSSNGNQVPINRFEQFAHI